MTILSLNIEEGHLQFSEQLRNNDVSYPGVKF